MATKLKNFRIDERAVEILEKLAAQQACSQTEIVHRALGRYHLYSTLTHHLAKQLIDELVERHGGAARLELQPTKEGGPESIPASIDGKEDLELVAVEIPHLGAFDSEGFRKVSAVEYQVSRAQREVDRSDPPKAYLKFGPYPFPLPQGLTVSIQLRDLGPEMADYGGWELETTWETTKPEQGEA